MVEVHRSRNYSWGRHTPEEVSTTYVTVEADDGRVDEFVLEELLDLPTAYPLDPELHGASGDYTSFVAAQRGGKHAARQYAMRHSENLEDPDNTERRRRIAFAKVMRLSRELPSQG